MAIRINLLLLQVLNHLKEVQQTSTSPEMAYTWCNTVDIYSPCRQYMETTFDTNRDWGDSCRRYIMPLQKIALTLWWPLAKESSYLWHRWRRKDNHNCAFTILASIGQPVFRLKLTASSTNQAEMDGDVNIIAQQRPAKLNDLLGSISEPMVGSNFQPSTAERMRHTFVSRMLRKMRMKLNLSDKGLSVPICHRGSAKDYILGFRDRNCPCSDESASRRPRFVSVTEGDDRWLQMASDMIHEDKCDYVALLFYASWCPFSGSIRPSFDVISLIYSSVPHFAIEESSVKASTLSKYGVHGFPTIILLNSTMRLAYRGSRTLDSIVTFYRDITGIETLDETSVEKNRLVPQFGNQNSIEPENCPVSWARRSPDNLFRQETYLALATVFVVLRLLHLIFPVLVTLAKFTWGRIARNMRPGNFLEHVVAMYLKEPCMSSNLQGAMNARAWASKSLATVSIGDSSLTSSRSVSTSQ
ncbi:hypothetical protein EUTSA_v10028636mg [Eutrema salsugineum]|uniref:Thioredoxin domain-containing protein n=2 Tax=Eutrema salsugineum TaxID=72664 RepID=V4LG13_EUTSA|nr:hypothetical protein EUTSA_v10028636mg [Eutrema salsugineum]